MARASATRRPMPPESCCGYKISGATQTDSVQFRQHDGADQALGQPGVFAQRKRDVLEHVQVREQRPVLEQHAHAPAQGKNLLAVQLGHVEAVHDHLAVVSAYLPGDQLQQGGLARAARPHDGRDGAAADLDVERAEDGLARVHVKMDIAQDGNRRRLDRRSGGCGRSGLVIHELVVWSLNGNGPHRSARVPWSRTVGEGRHGPRERASLADWRVFPAPDSPGVGAGTV